MKSKIFGMLMLAGIFGTTNAYAQDNPSSEKMHQIRTSDDYYKNELSLTDEQHEKVKKINKEYFDALAAMKSMNTSRLSKLKTFRSLSEDRDRKMKNVLNKDQYKKFEAIQKELINHLKTRKK